MALGMGTLEYLAERRLLTRSTRMLDIGSQNLYNASQERVVTFLQEFGRRLPSAQIEEAAQRISSSSIVRAGERTAFLADLLDLTDIDYLGYDVCTAPRTEFFDLNSYRMPDALRGSFDLVLNFGTTEHVINQVNAFEVIHDALRVGGVVMHQLPSVGYVDHGYFNYNPLLLNDLVQVNRYEVIDRFYSPSSSCAFQSQGVDVRDADHMGRPYSGAAPKTLQNYNINYVLRKTVDAPFYVGLELRTSHGPLFANAAASYGQASRRSAADLIGKPDAPIRRKEPIWRRAFRSARS